MIEFTHRKYSLTSSGCIYIWFRSLKYGTLLPDEIPMQDQLRISIIQTLAFADVFSVPLSKEELYKFLWCPPRVTFEEFLVRLPEYVKCGDIGADRGYYSLPHRGSLTEERNRSVPIIDKKLRIARRAAVLLTFVPFVEAFFVCNTVASAAAKEDSDIDVFIIVKDERLWIARLLVTVLLSIVGMRRTGAHVANKICLSFYATNDALDFSSITIDDPDIYLAQWIPQLLPLYDPYDRYSDIMKKNSWVFRYMPHARESFRMACQFVVTPGRWSLAWRRIWETMWKGRYGDLIESQAKALQYAKMKLNYRSVQHANDSRVVITDSMLKFHENDRRAQYRDVWKDTCRKYGIHL